MLVDRLRLVHRQWFIGFSDFGRVPAFIIFCLAQVIAYGRRFERFVQHVIAGGRRRYEFRIAVDTTARLDSPTLPLRHQGQPYVLFLDFGRIRVHFI